MALRTPLLLCLAALSAAHPAAASELDPAFDGDGVARAEAGVGDALLNDVDVASDGSVLGGGRAYAAAEFETRAVLARWAADGALDRATVYDWPPIGPIATWSIAHAVLAAPAGGAWLGGEGGTQNAIGFIGTHAADGTRTALIRPPIRTGGVSELVRVADGSLVGGGGYYGNGHSHWEIYRYGPDGQPGPVTKIFDDTFDGSKLLGALVPVGTGVVAVGTVDDAITQARVRADGTLEGAPTVVDIGPDAAVDGATAVPGGEIVATLYVDGHWGLARFKPDGTFKAWVSLPVSGVPHDIVWDGGALFVAGESRGRFTVARVLGDGRLDPKFGTGGVIHPVGGSSDATALAVAPSGGAVASGWSTCWGKKVMTVVRIAPPDAVAGGDPTVLCGERPASPEVPAAPIVSTSTSSRAGAAVATTLRIAGRVSGLTIRRLARRPVRGALPVRVGWAAGSRARAEVKIHAVRRGRRVLVASLRFTISGGTGATLRVPLTVTGRRIFGASGRRPVPVRVTLRATATP